MEAGRTVAVSTGQGVKGGGAVDLQLPKFDGLRKRRGERVAAWSENLRSSARKSRKSNVPVVETSEKPERALRKPQKRNL